MHNGPRKRSSHANGSARSVVEPLESRTLLSATLKSGTLNVVGTNGNDVISISRDAKNSANYLVSINKVVSSFAATSVKAIKVSGLAGDDRILISDRTGKVEAPAMIDGGAGNDVIFAAATDDLILGGTGNDSIDGGAGNDCLYGDAGNDTLLGNHGNDVLGGDDEDLLQFRSRKAVKQVAGNDLLSGGPGDDWLLGGTGNTVINDASGTDTLYGGKGRDVLDARGTSVIKDARREDYIPAQNFGAVGDGDVHTHVTLRILVRSGRKNYLEAIIPNGVGFFQKGAAELHTHDDSGTLHYEPTTDRPYTLMTLFRYWGVSMSPTHVGRHMITPTTPIKMTVNGTPNAQISTYQPKDGDTIVLTVG